MFNKLLEAFKITVRNDKHLFRRYLILGSFDGLLVAVSVLVASVLSGVSEQKFIPAVVSGIIGVTISSMWNTLIVELKEKQEELKELERQMMRTLKGTIYDYSNKLSVILSTISHSLSPLLGLVVILIYNLTRNVSVTIFLSAISLSILGFVYEGDLKEKITTAILMFIAGLIASFLSILIATSP
ncbi:MAG: hypothetical protein RXQ80_00930 [Sulfolobaceae archaeon]|nr:hypothetical protein [Sulfolobaceae archaeon]